MGTMTDRLTNDLFPQALLPITLQGPADLEGFRRAARGLLAQHMLPEQVSWHCSNAPVRGQLARAGETSDAPAISVPPEFMALAESTILHRDPDRFDLLYRILWRLAHEPGLRHAPPDADMLRAQQMAQAVRDEMHQMKAFMRFRSVQDDTFRSRPEGGLLHLAWFEPEHHIVEAMAPFFARRFAQMRWAILTPERSVEWDYIGPHARHGVSSLPPEGAGLARGGPSLRPAAPTLATAQPGDGLGALRFGPGVQQSDAPPPDADAQSWLSCYQDIFHPARLRLRTMPKNMSRRYWNNLSETSFTSPPAAPSAATAAAQPALLI